MPSGWEGNRRSGVALAMRQGLSGLSTHGLNGRHGNGDEHPAHAPEGHGTFYLYLLNTVLCHKDRVYIFMKPVSIF